MPSLRDILPVDGAVQEQKMNRRAIRLHFFVAVFVASISAGAGWPPTHAADAWNAASAAKYLDARMDMWWSNAKVLKTGGGEERCLSCHTAVPYVLARPKLRRILGENAATSHEARIVDTARARVASLGSQQPYYDNNEDKKLESRGVEAVLNAFVLASNEAEMKELNPHSGTVAAMARLWDVQRADGAWDWLNFGLEPYEAPDAVFHGATLAAIAAGSPGGATASRTPAGAAGVDRLRGYLKANVNSQRLFNKAWALIAASRFTFLTPEERAAIVGELQAAQRADGGWSMNDLGTWRWNKTDAPFAAPGSTDSALLSSADGYATGLAVYALRQSVARGTPAITRGQRWLREHQAQEIAGDGSWAPWRAHSLNYDREHGGPKGEAWRRMFMSDLATAFAVLALAD
jgi:squalene-hopene/tetraprenyl-beta-curcumene cyclase